MAFQVRNGTVHAPVNAVIPIDPDHMRVVLISPYELGRQPFGLAQPSAWLRQDGFSVTCLDLALERLEPSAFEHCGLVAIYVAMHTATRIAIQALPRIRELAPDAHLCIYGLYAPVNEALFREMGAGTVLGGEFEPSLLGLAQRLRDGEDERQTDPVVHLGKIAFVTPDRSGLPPLSSYAKLLLPDDSQKTVGFAEASRGCKHLCRHCPVVPVYEGKFRIVPVDVVMEDVRAQVDAGAEHISFGDPDFFNGPTHALKLVERLHAEFPALTYDATIKVEHIIAAGERLEVLAETGCLFLTTAVESVDEQILRFLDKNHTRADFERSVSLLRSVGIDMAPTFLPFTPWTTLEGYVDLLQELVDLRLVHSVPAIQLAIRLLIPRGSYLLRLPGFEDLVDPFDATILGYPWRHSDARVDALQVEIQSLAEAAEQQTHSRRSAFEQIWAAAHAAVGASTPPLPEDLGEPIAHHSEPWYCCAEPTTAQLQSF